MNAGARCVIIALAICSWIAISNHCAFAAVATKNEPAKSECPFHSKPEKPQNPPAGIQCCKILRAVVPTGTKSSERDDAKFSNVDLTVEQFIIFTASYNSAPLLLDTGPPSARTFAELILQRSLLVHAPPSLA
jgi:hypothetical protein